MSGGTITSANASITLVIPGLYTSPQQLQGFTADDITEIEEIEAAINVMGIDGFLSSGFVYAMIPQRIALMPDSSSIPIFDNWYQYELSVVEKVRASGILTYTSINTRYTMTKGSLTRISPATSARRTLSPRQWTIVWESVSPAPIGAAAA